MSDVKLAYGSNGQAITITLSGLANSTVREGANVDNASNLFADALVGVKVKTGASGGDAADVVNVYAYGSVDNASTFTGEATGSDGTVSSTRNLKLIGVIDASAVSTTFYGGPYSIAQAFGGVVPENWGVALENDTGASLDATASNHHVKYQGIYATIA